MTSKLRSLVSKKKLRFKQDGFDLDLSYVTPRLIAMGFPSEGLEATYRNKMKDVKNFFLNYHDGHYKVYNLCSERSYSANHFKNATASFPFDDHNPCAFDQLIKFCEDAEVYMQEGEKNVIAVHCKAGKGRTGLVLCCYMQFTGECDSPEEALALYGHARTQNGKGVTIPSQIRWVHYFGEYLKKFRRADPPRPFPLAGLPIVITGINLYGFPNIDGAASLNLYFVVSNIDKTVVYSGKGEEKGTQKWTKTLHGPSIGFNCEVAITGNLHVTFYYNGRYKKDNKMFGFWLHTSFMSDIPDIPAGSGNAPPGTKEIKLFKSDLDNVVKDTKHSTYPENFYVSFTYKMQNQEEAAQTAQTPVRDGTEKKTSVKASPDISGLGRGVPTKEGGVHFNPLRRLVSKKKRRFIRDGFDLDLSYITPMIIAMGFPSIGAEGLYRNKMSDVQRFLKHYHDGHYKVYNLCSERTYTPDYFDNNTMSYPFDDHNPCPFQMLFRFCEHALEYQSRDDENAVAIHCKAGKGRTGLMISALLMHNNTCGSADESLAFYGKKRTSNVKGVTIPSQQRYVRYYEEFLYGYHRIQRPFDFSGHPLRFCGVSLHNPINFEMGGGCNPSFKIYLMDRTMIYNSRHAEKNPRPGAEVRSTGYRWKKDTPDWGFMCKLPLKGGDIHIVFYNDDNFGKSQKMFGLWIHTSFIHSASVLFHKADLDDANKDKKHTTFPKDFECQLFFENFLPDPLVKKARRTSVHKPGSDNIAEKFKDVMQNTAASIEADGMGAIQEEEEEENSTASENELSEDEYVEGTMQPLDEEDDDDVHKDKESGKQKIKLKHDDEGVSLDVDIFDNIGMPELKLEFENIRLAPLMGAEAVLDIHMPEVSVSNIGNPDGTSSFRDSVDTAKRNSISASFRGSISARGASSGENGSALIDLAALPKLDEEEEEGAARNDLPAAENGSPPSKNAQSRRSSFTLVLLPQAAPKATPVEAIVEEIPEEEFAIPTRRRTSTRGDASPPLPTNLTSPPLPPPSTSPSSADESTKPDVNISIAHESVPIVKEVLTLAYNTQESIETLNSATADGEASREGLEEKIRLAKEQLAEGFVKLQQAKKNDELWTAFVNKMELHSHTIEELNATPKEELTVTLEKTYEVDSEDIPKLLLKIDKVATAIQKEKAAQEF